MPLCADSQIKFWSQDNNRLTYYTVLNLSCIKEQIIAEQYCK